jgi:two-component system sensor histidine kinase ChvG
LFNTLLLFLPLGAFMTLDVFESHMLQLQEEAMIAQGRMAAAALSGASGLDTTAKQLLHNLEGKSLSRIRITDPRGIILSDSAIVGLPAPITPDTKEGQEYSDQSNLKGSQNQEQSPLYNLGSLPFRFLRTLLGAPESPVNPVDDGPQFNKNPALLKALGGTYGAHTTISRAQRSVTLYSAFPIWDTNKQVLGAVIISRSTYRLLGELYTIRVSIFKIFLVSIGIAAILGILASRSIRFPLRRLRQQADAFLSPQGKIEGNFMPMKGLEEIRELSTALHSLGKGLQDHLAFIESFASDLAHEAKNPLSAIVCAAELLDNGPAASPRQKELSRIIQTEGQRLEVILEASRELSRIDVAIARAPCQILDPRIFLTDVARTWQIRSHSVTLDCHSLLPEVRVECNPSFLEQAIEKLIDNGLDFSSPGSPVIVRSFNDQQFWYVDVIDQGPGIPDDQAEVIFKRFHTGRSGPKGIHMGLGLTIGQAIFQAWGGDVRCLLDNEKPPGVSGAVFRGHLRRI